MPTAVLESEWAKVTGSRVELTCADCGEVLRTWVSQVLEKKLHNGKNLCRKCFGAARASGQIPFRREPERLVFECRRCGKQKHLRRGESKSYSGQSSYMCRPCFYEQKAEDSAAVTKVGGKRASIHKCCGCGKERLKANTEIVAGKGALCMSCARAGPRSGSWGGGNVKLTCASCGVVKEYSKSGAARRRLPFKCFPCSRASNVGSANPRWRGGIADLPYGAGWVTGDIRQRIRARDKLCRICGAAPTERSLDVHHIDYDKKNMSPSNLVALCRKCHSRSKRDDWIKFFSEMTIDGGMALRAQGR